MAALTSVERLCSVLAGCGRSNLMVVSIIREGGGVIAIIDGNWRRRRAVSTKKDLRVGVDTQIDAGIELVR